MNRSSVTQQIDARGVIYCRISDDPTGRAAGVDRQSAECHELATRAGVDVIDELIDNDISATAGKRRPGYERVLEMVRGGMVDTVIVWHTDRLYRLPRDLEPIIDLADGRRLRFLTVTASEIDLNTPSGRMTARILASVSANEVEHKKERQRSESDQRARRGEPTTRPGYGLRREGDHVVEIPDEAVVIRETVRRVLAGESMRGVAADLNDRGIPSPSGKPWQGISVRRAIQRPSITGLRVHRGQIVGDAKGDRIIDRDTWERLDALLRDPARKTQGPGRPPQYLLSGIAVCGLCGSRTYRVPGWTPQPHHKSQHATSPAYACKQCRRVRRTQAPLDAYIEEIILRRLEQPDAVSLFDRGDDDAAALARGAIATIDAKLATAADQFADDVITSEQLMRISTRLRADRDKQERLVMAAMPSTIPPDAAGPMARATWARSSMDVRRAIVRALITLTILPAGSGRSFDPATVRVEWLSEVS